MQSQGRGIRNVLIIHIKVLQLVPKKNIYMDSRKQKYIYILKKEGKKVKISVKINRDGQNIQTTTNYKFKFKFKFIYSHLFNYNTTTIRKKNEEVKNRANYTLN